MKDVDIGHQQFEKITSRKEANKLLKTIIDDNGGETWTDEDSSLYVEYRDGTNRSYILGDSLKDLNISKITKLIFNNPGTICFYNAELVYNDRYDDYDVE